MLLLVFLVCISCSNVAKIVCIRWVLFACRRGSNSDLWNDKSTASYANFSPVIYVCMSFEIVLWSAANSLKLENNLILVCSIIFPSNWSFYPWLVSKKLWLMQLDDGLHSSCGNGRIYYTMLQDGNHSFVVCTNSSGGVGCANYDWIIG